MLERVGALAYRLALPPNMSRVYIVFHVPMIKKYINDDSHIFPNFSDLEIQPNVTYVEKPIRISAREDKVLRRKFMPLVKVLWNNRGIEEAT